MTNINCNSTLPGKWAIRRLQLFALGGMQCMSMPFMGCRVRQTLIPPLSRGSHVPRGMQCISMPFTGCRVMRTSSVAATPAAPPICDTPPVRPPAVHKAPLQLARSGASGSCQRPHVRWAAQGTQCGRQDAAGWAAPCTHLLRQPELEARQQDRQACAQVSAGATESAPTLMLHYIQCMWLQAHAQGKNECKCTTQSSMYGGPGRSAAPATALTSARGRPGQLRGPAAKGRKRLTCKPQSSCKLD